MGDSDEFLNLVLNTLPEHVVVIDEHGVICFVNRSWIAFGQENGCSIDLSWIGQNYLDICDKAGGDYWAKESAAGIRRVIRNEKPDYCLEYPCHSVGKKRWFILRTASFEILGSRYFVISHQQITERKLAEEKIIELASLDGLTTIPNRRTFDQFLCSEWRRCERLDKTLSIALIDVDYFKMVNDNFGHQVGDECLVQLAALLQNYVQRPGDLCARYGGDEFVVVWGDIELEQASQLIDRFVYKLAQLEFEGNSINKKSPVTVSVGLAAVKPSDMKNSSAAISLADHLLYQAKGAGRDCVVTNESRVADVRVNRS